MKPDLTPFLGQRVFITIDRPLGSRHPRHADLVYPVNYGFLPGTTSGDGMPVDVYVLGVDEPRDRAKAVVIAVVVRANDAEDKLVAVLAGKYYNEKQIADAIEFQEQHFDSRIVMGDQ